MIILNREAILVLEDCTSDNINYTHAYIQYFDGYKLEIGNIKKGEGNFLFDSNFVYKWPLNKGTPIIFDIKNRCEILNTEERVLVLSKYKK